MSHRTLRFSALLLLSLFLSAILCSAQSAPSSQDDGMGKDSQFAQSQGVPRLIKFGGTIKAEQARQARTAVLTFELYSEREGGAPLWQETQTVPLDENGRYTALLGAAHANGVPSEVFLASEARWMAVRAEGETEQPRVLLVSVPYALKAGDSETLGGLPASAYALASSIAGSGNAVTGNHISGRVAKISSTAAPKIGAAVNTTGTVSASYLPKFTDSNGTVTNSSLFDNGAGSIGIGTTTPGGALAIENGSPYGIVVGQNNVANPQQLLFGYNTVDGYGAISAVQQGVAYKPLNLQPNGGNVGIGTTTPTGKLAIESNNPFGIVVGQNSGANPRQLLFGYDTAGNYGSISAAEQGIAYRPLIFQQNGGNVGIGVTTPSARLQVAGGDVKISTSGTGVVFPDNTKQISAAVGTITGVTAGSGLSGGGTSGAVSLAVDPTAIQARVTGSCVSGQYVRSIAADGSVTCGVDATGGSFAGGSASFTDSTGANTGVVTVTQNGAGTTNPDALTNIPPAAVYAVATSTTGWTAGVWGKSVSPNGIGVLGIVTGAPTVDNTTAVVGIATSTTGKTKGVSGQSASPDGQGGNFKNTSNTGTALQASVGPDNGQFLSQLQVQGGGISLYSNNITLNGPTGPSPNVSIQLGGNVQVTNNLSVGGSLSKGSGSFKIDHPLDPANKYLYHSFVESPDMMNIYNGVIALDATGAAWVTMPEWFEALNQEFRYQLTAMGAPAPRLYIAREVHGNKFKIAGGRPNGKVSWQVTGIRHDAYADKHRIPVEEDKSPAERGHYLAPDAFGKPDSLSVFAIKPAVTPQPAAAVRPGQD